MNILLLGSNGFIGSHLVDILKEEYNVVASHLRLVNTLEIIDLIEKKSINIVIHLVSNLIPSSLAIDFYRDIESVLKPTFKLIDYCAAAKIKFIYFSSGGSIYGDLKNNYELTEEERLNPKNYYGLSKKLIEDYIIFKNTTIGLNYLIVRPSNVYGEGQGYNRGQGFIGVAIEKIHKNKKLCIWGDGSSTKNYIYVKDLIRIVAILIGQNRFNRTLNIGSKQNASLLEIVQVISKKFAKPVDIVFEESKSFDVKNIHLSTKELESILHYDFTSLEVGISRQIDYYLNNKHD